MAHVAPLPREELEEFEPLFQAVERTMGFVPNSLFTMGHQPAILRAFTALSGTVMRAGSVDPALKQLVAMMASVSAGCRYCQAHASSQASRLAGSPAKVDAIFEFETSPLFSEGERAALRLARDAALVPNASTPGHFAALKRHYSEAEIVEIVSVISLFGWLNRWNDTMATDLEDEPAGFASDHLANQGWQPGKHHTSGFGASRDGHQGASAR